jgi:hypothetical protein
MFEIAHILSVSLDFFNKTWNYVIILIDFLIMQRSTYFYSEFYIELLCEFFIVLDHDEMNYNLVSGNFLKCILKCRFWLYAIPMNLMC